MASGMLVTATTKPANRSDGNVSRLSESVFM
jgi:hypothetical protein